MSIQKFLAKKNMTVLKQPPHSLELVPCDFFFFFPKLKGVIKEICFKDVDDIKKALMTKPKKILEESF